jgi:F0F1-type ATP synthase delta subunit
MKVSRTRIAGVIADRTLKDGVSSEFSAEIAAYLLSERRVGQLDSLLRDVQAAWAEAGQVEVTATSRYPLTSEVKADIKVRLDKLYPAAKQMTITEVRDPEVIGGTRLSLANRQLDVSVRAKLNKFKRLTYTGKD